MSLQETMIQNINDAPGIKVMELHAYVAKQAAQESNKNAFGEILDELIATGEVVKIDYVLDNSKHKSRWMLFPKNTKIYLNVI